MKTSFAVVGTDARSRAMLAWLQGQGRQADGAETAAAASVLLLPLPLDAGGKWLHFIQRARPGAVALGGRVSGEDRRKAAELGVPLWDYLDSEALALLNAVPTAEGALLLLLQERQRTLWGSPVALLGYGRVGQALGRRLLALGARPLVAARSAQTRARALADGCRACDFAGLAAELPGFDTVVNTVPAPVLGEGLLKRLPGDALLLELASAPGGVDEEAAGRLGLRLIKAPGLPGKTAPVTAGELLGRAALELLREKGVLT